MVNGLYDQIFTLLCTDVVSVLVLNIPLVNGYLDYYPEGNTGEDADYGATDLPASSLVTPMSDKEKNWLYTLDPILVTIIAMSSLGVLLGAICAGLLLYCTCSYSGLSSRSSTTLENYNFELYDGVKHKVKINPQKCCSEA
ncbi:hypothetical protein NDU88_003453 [Pleurodeles waltl]|uniref:Neuropilin C-terminal domain-containing protein n=1 Tax=Pleurodeles waltl TaxID=8319 RepID=A0AAV7UCL4_PLEWA|nr:hypothetical protein NDU88_003453 [Pleurodeles waltl]